METNEQHCITNTSYVNRIVSATQTYGNLLLLFCYSTKILYTTDESYLTNPTYILQLRSQFSRNILYSLMFEELNSFARSYIIRFDWEIQLKLRHRFFSALYALETPIEFYLFFSVSDEISFKFVFIVYSSKCLIIKFKYLYT